MLIQRYRYDYQIPLNDERLLGLDIIDIWEDRLKHKELLEIIHGNVEEDDIEDIVSAKEIESLEEAKGHGTFVAKTNMNRSEIDEYFENL